MADDTQRRLTGGGYLEVGISPDGAEVVVNHPDLQPDQNGVGHIVFTSHQARHFALLLIKKANEVDTISRRYHA